MLSPCSSLVKSPVIPVPSNRLDRKKLLSHTVTVITVS